MNRLEQLPRFEQLWIRGGVATLCSVAVNVVLVVLADILGIDPDLQALTVPPVILLSAVGAIGATVVYWILQRRSEQPARTFRRLALAVLFLSFVPDIAIWLVDETATLAGVIVLMIMHVTVAGICLAVLPDDRDTA
jgi:hypothetical protein